MHALLASVKQDAKLLLTDRNASIGGSTPHKGRLYVELSVRPVVDHRAAWHRPCPSADRPVPAQK